MWEIDFSVEPNRVMSAVHRSQSELQAARAEEKILDGAALAQLGIDFVEV